jgi:hypothetical protein
VEQQDRRSVLRGGGGGSGGGRVSMRAHPAAAPRPRRDAQQQPRPRLRQQTLTTALLLVAWLAATSCAPRGVGAQAARAGLAGPLLSLAGSLAIPADTVCPLVM